MNSKSPYSASFTGCSFMLYEMLRMLPLFMSNNAGELISNEVRTGEVLMVNALSSRKKYVLELSRRFNAVPRKFWEDFVNFSECAQRLGLFYVLMQCYRLVFDFHLNVTIKRWNSINQHVVYEDVAQELSQIAAKDEFVDSWTASTKKRVVSAYLTFLNQAGLVERKTGELHRTMATTEDYAYYVRTGKEWFLEASLLLPYEIEKIKQSMVAL